MSIWEFILIGIAVWRLSNMLADTDQAGLLNILDWIRVKAGIKYDAYSVPYAQRGSIGDMILCVYCNSVWIGTIFVIAYYLIPSVTIIVSIIFSLSGVAILLEEWNKHGRGKTS